jgi:SAM-dependent methyltransferase
MTTSAADLAGYRWTSAEPTCAHAHLLPAVRRILADGLAEGRAKRVFDLGRGNGATARMLAGEAWEVAGVDPSEEGIARASGLDLCRKGSAYDDLAGEFGRCPSCSAWRSCALQLGETPPCSY